MLHLYRHETITTQIWRPRTEFLQESALQFVTIDKMSATRGKNRTRLLGRAYQEPQSISVLFSQLGP